MGTARGEGTSSRGRSQARAPPSVLSRAAPSFPRTRREGALSLRARSCRGIAGRGRGVEKGEGADRPGGSDSRGRGSANLRALTRGAAPRRSDICPPGRGHREAPPWALRSGRRCTCRGSPAARCAPRPLRLPIGPRGPAPSLPSGSPPPGRSARGPNPVPKSRPFSTARPGARRGPGAGSDCAESPPPSPGREPRQEWGAAWAIRAPDERGGPRAGHSTGPQLRGRGPLDPVAEGAAAPESREGPTRDGPAGARLGGGRFPRGAGLRASPELVAAGSQMHLDPCGASFGPS